MAIVIEEPFSGFPGVVQGGYLGGVLARALGGSVEVTYRKPAAIGQALELERADGKAALRAEGAVVAEAAPARVDLELPAPVDLEEARAASARYPGHGWHPFPLCFCCGPGRGSDGLRIFTGPVRGRELMAAVWTPEERFAEDGAAPVEVVWAALDCPAIWGLALRTAPGSPEKIVSGRIAAEIRGRIEAGRPHLVLAWPLGAEGRKLFCAAAIFDERGEPLAVARQTCIVTEQGVPLGRWGLKPTV